MARIGVDLGGTKIEAIILEANGEIVARKRVATPKDYTDKIKTIAALVHGLEDDVRMGRLPVGLGHPGSLNPRSGLMRNANSTDLNGKRLDADLSRALNRIVRCANDADCFALSEALDGAGAHHPIVFGVIIGTGVGGGIVINGRIHKGASDIAGEWGHTALPRPSAGEVPGPLCQCGRRGCMEAWCSGPGLSGDYFRNYGDDIPAEIIADMALEGQQPARDTLERHRDRLARGLSSVINILDPDIIVLGGGLSNLPGIAEDLQERIKPHVFSDDVTTKIVKNRHGDSSGVRGAAWLWPEPGQ